jgi:ParB-like chromosome segregation protein Spo0J
MTTQISSATDATNLYDRDYYLWLSHTANLISEGKFSEVDAVNLIEEIQDMGRSEKRAIESNLVVLLLHLLKYKYQSDKRTNSWKSSIREHRRRLRKALSDSPSLKRHFEQVVDECYQDAREQAADETGLPIATFPQELSFTLAEVLNPDYLPQD